MDRLRLLWMSLLVVLVPASSLVGLLRPMGEFGGQVFPDVWGMNFWGDAVFTLGTIGAALAAGWLVWRLRRQERPAPRPLLLLAVPLSFLLHWVVYALSWSWTGPGDGQDFFAWTFDAVAFQEAWGFTMDWGWPGLVFCAIAVPGTAWMLAELHGGAEAGQATPGAAP